MDTLPEISLGTAALIIFGLCAGYMFIRGLARTIVNVACLTLSAWVGFRVWQQAPSLAIDWFNKPSELVATGLPIVAFLATLIVLRRIVGFFRAPIPKSSEDVAPKSSGQLVFRLIITVIPTALLCLTAATMFVKLTVTFPMSSNHFMLELLNVLLLISFDARSREQGGLILGVALHHRDRDLLHRLAEGDVRDVFPGAISGSRDGYSSELRRGIRADSAR